MPAPFQYGKSDYLPVRKWLPVISSNLAEVMFVPHDNRTNSPNMMFIRFRSGGVYVYYNVPYKTWESLMTAGSKGRYHWRYIRGKFLYKRLS